MENYGIELELINFGRNDFNRGFSADFVLNRDVNYYLFGLYKVGNKDYSDKLVLLLNNEFSLNSSQKKGNSFNITRDMDLRRIANGTFYFQLESQDGMVYKSNQFHSNQAGSWLIKRPIGTPMLPEKKSSFISDYKFYIIGGGCVLGAGAIFFILRGLKSKT